MSNKKLPYGNCNFADIIESGYAYVDKTRYIELLENEANRYQFLLRPRRFGKSLFLTTLDNYYDLSRKDRFKSLFGNLYIGKNPTPEQGTYAILKFDFSGIDIENHEKFIVSFYKEVEESVCAFFNRYKNFLTGATEEIRMIKERCPGIGALSSAYNAAESAGIPIFVIIDEYDNFANELIAMGEAYRNEIMRNNDKEGIVRTFYKSLKKATSSIIRRIFITGVSPMMVNDLTSGFNIATDYSLIPKYNEMFGFTRDEVEWVMDETGIDRKLISVDMEYYYNGYMFDSKGKDKVYNSQMILFLFNQVQMRGEQPEQLVDPNLRTSYERLRNLAASETNREKLLKIAVDGGTDGYIINDFSLDKLGNEDYFVSILFYLGMLTWGETLDGRKYLKIPNYSVKTLYWQYVVEYAKDLNEKAVDTYKLFGAVNEMAYNGNIKPYLDIFVENYLKLFSNRDLINFDEKYVKAIMLPTLYVSNIYHPVSEAENISGYSDIYLQKNHAMKGIKFEYVFELKYVKTKASKKEKDGKFAEALTQIEKYKQDKRFAGRDDVKFVAIVFSGKSYYEMKLVP